MKIIGQFAKVCDLTRTYWNQGKVVIEQHPESLGAVDLAKCFMPWLVSLISERSPLDDEQPWITIPARHFLQKTLTPDFRVLEFGAGGSTLFFAKRVKELVTVEHQPEWLQRTASKVRSRENFRWQSLLEPPTR